MKAPVFISLLVLQFGLLQAQQKNNSTSPEVQTSEQLINTSVKIVGLKESIVGGKKYKFQSIGTGFFFKFSVGKDSILSIVTTLHLIKDCKEGILKFNSGQNGKTKYGDIISVHIKNFAKLWITHPTEDVAILPLLPILENTFLETKKMIGFKYFDNALVPTSLQLDSLSAIQQVIMIGYPKGFSDTVNNIPIVRTGLTATPIFLDYNKKRRFLVDIQTYSGSSGSPIILFDQGIITKGGSITLGSEVLLLGIAIESQEYTAKGKTISKDPKKVMDTQTPLPFGIAIAIKAGVLLDFVPILYQVKNNAYYIKLLKDNISSS
jgi:hypothetical protein